MIECRSAPQRERHRQADGQRQADAVVNVPAERYDGEVSNDDGVTLNQPAHVEWRSYHG